MESGTKAWRTRTSRTITLWTKASLILSALFKISFKSFLDKYYTLWIKTPRTKFFGKKYFVDKSSPDKRIFRMKLFWTKASPNEDLESQSFLQICMNGERYFSKRFALLLLAGSWSLHRCIKSLVFTVTVLSMYECVQAFDYDSI